MANFRPEQVANISPESVANFPPESLPNLVRNTHFCYLTVVLIPVALVRAIMRQGRAKEYVDDTLSRS